MSDDRRTNTEDDSEYIDPKEVDDVVGALADLIEKVKSETIKDYLEATCSDIAYLVAEDEDFEDEDFEDDDEDFDDDEDEDYDEDEDFDDEDFDDDDFEDDDEDFDEDEESRGAAEAA